LCGGFELHPALPDHLAEILPGTLVLDATAGLTRWLEPLFALLHEETEATAPGASANLRETRRRVPHPGAAQLPGGG
jgi:hypothetical protein